MRVCHANSGFVIIGGIAWGQGLGRAWSDRAVVAEVWSDDPPPLQWWLSFEESAASSAIESVCNRAKFRRFPQLSDREDLLQILVMVRARKVCDQNERRAVR